MINSLYFARLSCELSKMIYSMTNSFLVAFFLRTIMVSYNKLWKRMIDCGLKKTDLTVKAGISTNVMAKLGKNETVSMESMLKICKVLSCDIGDIMEVVEDERELNRALSGRE